MNISSFRVSMLVFALMLSTAGFSSAQKWSTSTDYDHHYTVNFPELPQEVHKNTPEGFKITDYATSAACTYMIKLLVMPSEPKDGTGMAQKTLNAMAAKLGGKVMAQEEWKHKDAIGTKALIDVPDKGEGKPQMKVFLHVIVVGNIQYQVIAMGPLELFEDAVAEHFLASFKFI